MGAVMSNLDRYLSTNSDIHPFWLLAPAVACAVLIIWLKLSGGEPEPMPREALPDPYVPQCYQVWGREPGYCEFRVRSVH